MCISLVKHIKLKFFFFLHLLSTLIQSYLLFEHRAAFGSAVIPSLSKGREVKVVYLISIPSPRRRSWRGGVGGGHLFAFAFKIKVNLV